MAFRALATGNDNTASVGDSSFTITVPAAVQAGDVMLVAAVMNTGVNTFTISGGGSGTWTTRSGPDDNSGNQRTYLWTKTAAAGAAGTTVTVTASAGGRFIGVLTAHSGVTETGILVNLLAETSGADTSLPFPTVTTPAAGWDVLGVGTVRAASASAASITAPAGSTVDGWSNTSTASPNYTAFAMHLNTPPAAGARSPGTATASLAVTDNLYTVALAPGAGSGTLALTGTGSVAFQGVGPAAGTLAVTGSGTLEFSGEGLAAPFVPATSHQWAVFARAANYANEAALPIVACTIVKRHMGVSKATLETDYTPERWDALQPSRGINVYRDGVQEFTGRVSARDLEWDKTSGRQTIHLEAEGEEARLAHRPTFPDPLRAEDDQTVNDYWMTRTGATAVAKVASTAMLQLISDQAGATCRADRQIPGIALGPDPAVGLSRIWRGLFEPVLDNLAAMSIASGQDLGLRVVASAGALTYSVVQPRNLTSTVVFSADLGNLVGFRYREEQPTVTRAVAAGQGNLHLRVRKAASSTDPLALAWGEQFWTYLDQSDTADNAALFEAGTDAVTEGAPQVSLAIDLRDSRAATYGTDYVLGDKVTVYVGLPGQSKVATVTDVIREIKLELDASGAETVTPAVGTWDASTDRPTVSQRKLAEVGARLTGLITRK